MNILSIDQGTTGTTAIIYDENAQLVKKAYREFKQYYPKPGWVEHDPEEIWQSVVTTIDELLTDWQGTIAAIGITNQRETTVVWDKVSGKSIHNAIVWQCRRTADICDQLSEYKDFIHKRTGLLLDAYFSGTKLKWLLENVDHIDEDNILFGTIDSWLIWKLTNGKVHATDYTNASRTMLFNIFDKKWDDDILNILNIPANILPEVKQSADDFGSVQSINKLRNIPIRGVAGDQQAALFGQKCFTRGQSKNTYGTGCFMLMNIGSEAVLSSKGLLTSLAVDNDCKPCYALEGSIFIAGAVVQWLRDELGIIRNSAESEPMATAVDDNGGVYFVPAFVGLGAPHWDMQVRGIVCGLTRGTGKNYIVRAALESMAYQTNDVLKIMENESGIKIRSLAVDGGATSNDFLMQFQSDILNIPVFRPDMSELTSLGAAFLAGLNANIWKNVDELSKLDAGGYSFQPNMPESGRRKYISGWQRALRQAKQK